MIFLTKTIITKSISVLPRLLMQLLCTRETLRDVEFIYHERKFQITVVIARMLQVRHIKSTT